jgi:hypothetical protein
VVYLMKWRRFSSKPSCGKCWVGHVVWTT